MVQFAVTRKDGEWTVFRDAQAVAGDLSRSAAIELARSLAFDAEARGEAVELLIQGYFGEVQTRLSGGEA